MPVNATMRYHYIPTKIAKIQKTDHSKCWQKWSNSNVYIANRSVTWHNYFRNRPGAFL